MTVQIITDSACDLPDSEVERLGLVIVPLSIRFDDEEYVDRIELTTAEFWKKANATSNLPSTAAPAPGAFAEAFRSAKANGHSGVVCITLSKELSATYQNAVAGAELVKGEVDVRVVDSTTCTVAQARIIQQTAERAADGAAIDEVEAVATSASAAQRLFGVLDTLDNLRKGGRIVAAGAFFAALLSVKPLITIQDGVVKPLSRQRTRSKALRALAEAVIAEGPLTNVGVSHSGAPDVEEFLAQLAPVADRDSILVTEMGPTIGVHGGPRLIAVTFAKV